jgi:hypothetical protein
MFDFIHIISPDPEISLVHNSIHEKYLFGINWKSEQVHGIHFKSEYFYHTDVLEKGIEKFNSIYAFYIGNIYTNQSYELLTNTLRHKIKTQELIEMYLQYGKELIKYIKGIFVLFIADDKKKQYYAYTSRSGLYKLYYCIADSRLLVSTSTSSILNNLEKEPDMDEIAIIQHSIYEYPLGERTHYKNIKILDNFSYIEYDLYKININHYCDLNLPETTKNLLPWKETYRLLPKEFNQSIDLIIPENKFNCALTGGFDSRTILSYLLTKSKLEYQLYSWAADERWHDVDIAKKIANEFHLKYTPIIFGKEMLNNYYYYSRQQIYWTNGLGSINRANQMYSHFILAKYARDLISGYFGSELFRPLSKNNIMVSDNFLDTYLNTNRKITIAKQITKMKSNSPFKPEFLRNNWDAFIEETNTYFNQMDILKDKGNCLFVYFIKTGFWKFFGQEFDAQRIHTKINTPYIDDDFVDFLLKTPIWKVQQFANNILQTNKLRGQAFYIPILKNNSIPLMKIPTNRGFSPIDFESFFYPINVIFKHFMQKRKTKKKNIIGFNSKDWNRIVYNADKKTIENISDIFNPLNDNQLTDGFWFSLKKHIITNYNYH